jgi:hypothetical protein
LDQRIWLIEDDEPWPVSEIAQKRLLFSNRSKEFTDKIKEILGFPEKRF